MFTALSGMAMQHDPRLLAGALAMCAASVMTALSAYSRAISAQTAQRAAWSGFIGLVLACGVWATQFLSMLAYEPRLTLTYGLQQTTLWSLAASLAIGGGVFVVTQGRGAGRAAGRVVGGAVAGGGIAALQIVNMTAMAAPVILGWDREGLALTLGLAIAGAAACAWVIGEANGFARRTGAVALMVFTIFSLHFTLLAATTLPPAALRAALAAGPDDLPLAMDVLGVIGMILASAIAMMLASRLSSHAALRSLQSALDEAPTAIGFFDRRQRLTFWNKPYAELFETFKLVPVVGLRFETILAAVTAVGIPYRVTAESARAGAFGLDKAPDELELPDGRIIHAKVAPTPDGGMVAVLTDMTLTRQAERLAQQAQERAEAANRLKSDFLANMSHEIRTPLNGVLGMTHVMEAGPLDPAQRERLQVIKTSGESLLALLNDLLDLAKVEAGHMELEVAPFDIEAALRPTCDAFAALAAGKGVAFDMTITPAAAGQWRGDAHRLRQVVANLAANAVKFTARGAVGVAVDATETGLRIIVRDTGIGMKAEQIPHLFEKFTQADSSSTRVFGGTGLGLAICRDLTGLMGGTLTARSIEGHGSIFTFEAPLRHVATPQAAAAKAPEIAAPDGRVRILAAEDNVINQKVLQALLEPLDVALVMTADGEEAVAAYKAGSFDLVLMDVQMPKMGGVEATRAIRAWETERGLARTPILAVTANLMSHQTDTYLAAGMDGLIAKPIEVPKLFAAITSVLPLQQAA